MAIIEHYLPAKMGEAEVDKTQTYVTARGIEYLSKTLNKGA
jgi:uncharacterized protein YqeY